MTSAPWLFAACTAIWGSTWLVITYQLGVVPPEISVVWRFFLAAVTLGGVCVATGRSLRFSRREHAMLALQGTLMFCLNYILIYWSEQHIVSGLAAVAFSTITIMSVFAQRVTFGTPVTTRALAGAVMGVSGVVVLFYPEIAASQGNHETTLGMALALVATLFAALGNMVAARMHRRQLAIFPTSAWAMLYGALASAVVAMAIGARWSFDFRMPYVLSLLYLSMFGTVVAFVCYLALMRGIGMAKASYVGVATPAIALLLSFAFEGYRFTVYTVVGIALAIAGNLIVLRRKPRLA